MSIQPTRERSETELAASLSAYFRLKNKPLASPKLNNVTVSLPKLYFQVSNLGGYEHCSWENCSIGMMGEPKYALDIKKIYDEHLADFEEQLKKKDPLDVFYTESEVFKARSYKPFDGNMILDRYGPLPLKELNAFLVSRNYGFNFMMQDRLSNMLRPINDPAKVAIMSDLGIIDTLTILKMLESGISDEIREALAIINLCSLEPNIDIYWVENPELFKYIMQLLKDYTTDIENGNTKSWPFIVTIVTTFSNISNRKELHKWLVATDLLDTVLKLSSQILYFLQYNLKKQIFIDLDHRQRAELKLEYSFELLHEIINLLYQTSCIASQLCCNIPLSPSRICSLFMLLSFGQLRIFEDYLVESSLQNLGASYILSFLEETNKNMLFTYGNLLILHENVQCLNAILSKCKQAELFSKFLFEITKFFPINDTTSISDKLTERYFEIHCFHRLICKELLTLVEFQDFFNLTKLVQQLTCLIVQSCPHASFSSIQDKALFIIRNITMWASTRIKNNTNSPRIVKPLNPLFLNWELVESWLLEILSDSRIIHKRKALPLLSIISKLNMSQ
eukprot:NODE_36_length_36011_cov_1.012920.p5 type:complete len:564 gc:universal NODE_36_length_36011_cov_1.012920:8568-10259(+)